MFKLSKVQKTKLSYILGTYLMNESNSWLYNSLLFDNVSKLFKEKEIVEEMVEFIKKDSDICCVREMMDTLYNLGVEVDHVGEMMNILCKLGVEVIEGKFQQKK